MTWEVDEFHGDNSGLVVAELELDSEDAAFSRPSWLGVEVTELRRYYNVCLVTHPFRAWTDAERNP
jgi:adenylate cyclase